MRVLVAPDKFRGTVHAAEAAAALAAAVRAAGHVAIECPLADGGEGTLAALGGPNRSSLVTGPLGDPVDAPWQLQGNVAVIEMALASGLALVGGAAGNDPVAASTSGTGELIAIAAESGARRILVGVGGSATTDGGFGALRAMYPLQRFRGVEIVVACDVRTAFLDAAEVFAPQKGATPAQVELLRRRLERLAQVYLDEYGVDVRALPRAGAAGGLAGALATAGARLVDGFELVAEHLGLDALIEECDLVVTGEGFLDAQSFDGKVVGGVVELAGAFDVPVLIVAGDVYDGADAGLEVISLVDAVGAQRARQDTAAVLRDVLYARLTR